MASVAELKEKHAAATASVNSLRERLRQRRETLLDTDGEASLSLPPLLVGNPLVGFGEFRAFADCSVCARPRGAVAKYSKSQGRAPVSFNPTDLVCCRTLQGHSGKVVDFGLSPPFRRNFSLSFRFLVCNCEA